MPHWICKFLKAINWNFKMKATLYAIFVLLVTVVLQLALNNTFVSDSRLIEAFSAGNVEDTEGELSCFAACKKTYLSKEDKKQMLIFLADGIGLHTEELSWEEEKSEGKQIIRAEKKAQDGDTNLSLITIGGEKEKKEYYLHGEIKLYNKLESLLTYKKRLCACLKELEVEEYQPMLAFSGEYEGKLSKQKQQEKIEKMLSILKADVVNENNFGTTKNIYGYTEFLEEYLVVNQKRVNVNLVLSYQKDKDKTSLYLAAPIYNQDY